MMRGLFLALVVVLLLSGGMASGEDTLDTPPSPILSEEAGFSGEFRTLEDWYSMGGPVMHLLALCSILVVGISLERFWHLRRGFVFPRRVIQAAEAAWKSSDFSGLLEVCTKNDSALSRLLTEGLSSENPSERVSESGRSEAQRMHRNLPLLAALANIATMLGLLGTVLGMIEAFELIAGAGTGDAKVVASGIFRALVTTAAGLGVGIVALALHAVFSRRADEWVHELEDFLSRILGDPSRSEDRSERAAVQVVK